MVWLPAEQGALSVGDCCEHFLIQFRTSCWSHLLGHMLKYDCGGGEGISRVWNISKSAKEPGSRRKQTQE